MQDITSNGHQPSGFTVTISQSDVRRLAKLQARAEGAVQVAQGAVNLAQGLQQALAVAIQEACSDEGYNIPPDSNADINWKTGEITITPPAPGRGEQPHIIGANIGPGVIPGTLGPAPLDPLPTPTN